MAMKTVAVFGGNADIVAILVRLINQYDAAEAVSFSTVEELLVGNFDLLLLSSSVSETDEALIRAQVSQPVIQHYGGGSGLLRAELLPYFD
jgi:hypothetical protein